jgi:hypothetical protein
MNQESLDGIVSNAIEVLKSTRNINIGTNSDKDRREYFFDMGAMYLAKLLIHTNVQPKIVKQIIMEYSNITHHDFQDPETDAKIRADVGYINQHVKSRAESKRRQMRESIRNEMKLDIPEEHINRDIKEYLASKEIQHYKAVNVINALAKMRAIIKQSPFGNYSQKPEASTKRKGCVRRSQYLYMYDQGVNSIIEAVTSTGEFSIIAPDLKSLYESVTNVQDKYERNRKRV